jgi:hypothetical protein
VFFYIDGIIHHEFGPHGQTVNHHFYKGVSQRVQEVVRLKCPGMWHAGDWCCMMTVPPLYLAKNNIPVVPHHLVPLRSGSQ